MIYNLYNLSIVDGVFFIKEQTRDALEQCTAAVHSLSEHATLLESERDARQKALIKLEEKLMSTSKEKQESSSDHEWYCN